MEAKEHLAAYAAWLQHVDGRSNIEIAATLGVSRLRVPKLVRWAESEGIASVSIRRPIGVDWGLSERIRQKFGLADALVADSSSQGSVGLLAARYVSEVLVEGSQLGVAWGSGSQEMAVHLEFITGIPQSDVVQLIGGLPESPSQWSATELLVRLSRVLGGNAAALLAPMILPDAATAEGLRREPSIAHAFHMMERLNVAVVGVGSWEPAASRVKTEMSVEELRALKAVSADVCGILLADDGEVVGHEISRRIMAIDEVTLRRCPVRIAVSFGEKKVGAIRTVLRSGLVSVLCTDYPTAKRVLEDPS